MKKYNINELEALNKFVGTNKNIKSHNNCITRFRFSIIDKNLVDTNQINKLSFVKGINWAGNELQVIIGPEVINVRDQYMNLFSEPNTLQLSPNQNATKILEKHQFSFKKTFTSFVSNVIVPIIPALMAAGLLQALYSILVSAKILEAVNLAEIKTPAQIVSGVFNIIADTGLKFLGFLIGFNTIRYLGGKNINLSMAVLVPLVLTAPHLFPNTTWTLYSFAQLPVGNNQTFDVGIKIMGYSSMFLPQIAAGILYVYLDRWIKTWMPSVVDIIFRHFLSILIVALVTFFALGPVLSLIESAIYFGFFYIQRVPYGFGNAIFGASWTFLVLTGMHSALGVAIANEVNNNGGIGSQLLALTSITSMTTIGTCLAVTIRAKEATMKKLSFGSLFAGAFGVSEPTYYSISMLRPILFVPVIIARSLGGLFIGVFDVRAYQNGGRGILGFTAALPKPGSPIPVNTEIALSKMFGAMIFVFAICFLLTLMVYQEHKTDKKNLTTLYSTILKTLQINKDKNLASKYKAELENIKKNVSTKQYKIENKAIENIIVKQNNLKYKLLKKADKVNVIETKYDKKINKLDHNIEQQTAKTKKFLQTKTHQNSMKKSYLKEINYKNQLSKIQKEKQEKIDKLNYQIQELTAKNQVAEKEVSEVLTKLEKQHLKLEQQIKTSFTPLLNKADLQQQEKIHHLIFNAVHNLEINYKIIDKQEV